VSRRKVNTKRSYLVRRQSRHIEKHHVLHDSIFALLMTTNFRYSLILVFFSVPMPASIVSSTFYLVAYITNFHFSIGRGWKYKSESSIPDNGYGHEDKLI